MRSDWACGKLIVSWFGSPKTTRFLGENLGPPHGFSTFFADDPFLGVIYDLNLTPSPMQYQMLSRWFWNVWTYIINIILYYIIYRRWIQTTISDRKRRTKLPKPQIDSSLVCVFFATWPFFLQIYIIPPQDHDSGVGCLYRQVGGIRVSMRHFLSQTSWYPFRGVATHIYYISSHWNWRKLCHNRSAASANGQSHPIYVLNSCQFLFWILLKSGAWSSSHTHIYIYIIFNIYIWLRIMRTTSKFCFFSVEA